MLADTCEQLEKSGVAVRSEGALCVFFDDIKGKDGEPVPLIVQKADGGYGYAATDLSAIRNRTADLHADTLLYVVDVRQSLHFKMVFETARRAGWLPAEVTARHLPFGTVLGPDGKPFKTRAGETVRLEDLLDEAVDRATAVVREKGEKIGLSEEEITGNGRQVGIGAVKYADLSTSLGRDYVFDLDRMVSLHGDTSVYIQYAYARTRSIFRKAGEDQRAVPHPELTLEPAERALGLHLDAFGEALAEVATTYEPHRLASYLFQLASLFTTFYEQCPVLTADGGPAQVEGRLFLCDLTARTLHQGLSLLGIRTPERL
jgi:arginyl-tRNA synthetase